ncbi:hypothetical protein MAPG_06971 [Magnaporthiopsis poae ATCC 64411]|uniref:Heterokaryon incompatibility domain-containing protein n=1 Tax=Magnaporthiopsis poae (strain ATCC 64411 / 73-15) TaxID=644358 RepID=A0A0C4E3H2_MAGP6|nr:hypothetical protein MAPG_06971 [Magnaporthiopsis poae ATCC 64411]
MGSPCERCNDLTFDGICRTKEKAAGASSLGTYPDTFPEFPALARLGETCEACHLIWDGLTSAITFDTDKDAEPFEDAGATVTYALAYAAEPGIPSLPRQGPATDDRFSLSLRLRIDIELPPGTPNKSHYSIELPIKPLKDKLASWLGVRPLQPFLCARNIDLIRFTLADCEKNHPRCRPRGPEAFLPTRLIDLGPSGSNSVPKLIVTAQDPGAGDAAKYATLSYCWGTPPEAATQLKTTTDTMRQRLEGIPLAIMSRVMQDAVAVCRAIGIRYLWIDALCIIQGDRTDWAHESELMGKVYHHSHLTICAAASESCNQTFLERSNDDCAVFPFRSSERADLQGEEMLLQRPEEADDGPELAHSRWAGRGWVYQEQMLSPRCLVIGSDKLHVYCLERMTSETGRVHDGSARAQFAEALGLSPADYVAGLWAPFFPGGLFWRYITTSGRLGCCPLREHLEALRAPSPFIAPSWSPLGQIEAISRQHVPDFPLRGHIRTEYEAIEGTTARDSPNQYGTVTSGRLRATARTVPMPSDLVFLDRPGREKAHWRADKEGKCAAYCILDWAGDPAGEPAGDLVLLLLCSACSGGRADFYDWDDGLQFDDEHGTYPESIREVKEEYSQYMPWDLDECLPRMEECLLCKSPSGLNRHVWGLILHPTDEPDVFFRVGVFASRAWEAGGTALFDEGRGGLRTLDIL